MVSYVVFLASVASVAPFWKDVIMYRSIMDIICCPVDKADLELIVIKEDENGIVEGKLKCTKCGYLYPIENGIPNLLPPRMLEMAEAKESHEDVENG